MADPAWRNECRPASFRDVPFEVRARRGKGGRRGPDHQYPGAEEGYAEDTGKKTKTYSVEAFIFGPDYMAGKNRLIAALDTPGPGEYVDLWGDTWKVQVRDFDWNENIAQGGYVAFQIEFKEAGRARGHSVSKDTGYAVAQAGTGAKAVLVGDFGKSWNVRGNNSVLDHAVSQAGDFLDKVTGGLRAGSSANSGGKVAALLSRVAALRDGLTTRLASGSTWGGDVAEVMAASMAARSAGANRYDAARAFDDWGSGAVDLGGVAGAQIAANQTAFATLVQGLAGVEAANAAADMDFTVYDDAVALRDNLAALMDRQLLVASDDVYTPLSSLRAAMVRDITARGADLTRLTDYTPHADVPALVLAQRLWGDASRETDILTRNHIRHPGFVPGGKTLKVPVQ